MFHASFQIARVIRFAVGALVLSACGCSSSTAPAPPSPPTHPAGDLVSTTYLAGRPFGAAIAPNGEALLTVFDSSDVATAKVTPAAFGPFIGVSSGPIDVAITPDGTRAFVTNNYALTVSVIDMRSQKQTSTLTAAASPTRVKVSPDGSRVYVTTAGDNIVGSELYVYDARSLAPITHVRVGGSANGIAIDSAAGRLYVSSLVTDSIYEVSMATNTVLRSFHGGPQPQEVIVTPDHNQLWVANEADSGIVIIDLASGSKIATVPNTPRAFGMAITPDGAQVYVTMFAVGTFSIVDVASRTVLKTTSGGFNSAPARIAFTADGSRAVIADLGMGMLVVQ